MTRRLRAFVELTRPPNVATALADVLAGCAVAGATDVRALAALVAATACLYAGGIVFNDVFDRQIDAHERPERPIPSGRVTAAGAAVFGAALLFSGIAAATLVTPAASLVALGIAAAALTYDAWTKHHTVAGPLNMGLCRALNLVLGMTAVPAAAAEYWPLALINLAYITAVTLTSRSEVSGGRTFGHVSLTLLAAAGVALVTLAVSTGPSLSSAGALVITAVMVWRVLPAFWRARQTGLAEDVRTAVRTGVLSLVLVDAAITASYAGMMNALGIIVVALVAVWLARTFAVT